MGKTVRSCGGVLDNFPRLTLNFDHVLRAEILLPCATDFEPALMMGGPQNGPDSLYGFINVCPEIDLTIANARASFHVANVYFLRIKAICAPAAENASKMMIIFTVVGFLWVERKGLRKDFPFCLQQWTKPDRKRWWKWSSFCFAWKNRKNPFPAPRNMANIWTIAEP